MPVQRTPYSSFLPMGFMLAVCSLLLGCPTPYEWRHENQWDSREQIGMAEASQVKLRAAQSRVFDTSDSRRILEAVVSTMQDLNFKVQVLDEELGLVSGKLLLSIERPASYIRLFPTTSTTIRACCSFQGIITPGVRSGIAATWCGSRSRCANATRSSRSSVQASSSICRRLKIRNPTRCFSAPLSSHCSSRVTLLRAPGRLCPAEPVQKNTHA